jgi:hypothetical protein
MRRRTAWLSGIAALLLVAGVVVAAYVTGREREAARPTTRTETTEPTAPPGPPATETEPTEPTPPPPTGTTPPTGVPFDWSHAGAFVWHETSLDPSALGRTLRAAGFGWVALRVHDGLAEDPVEDDWANRLKAASGLPVGGWGVLRTDPRLEAELADRLLARDGLDFYIANAEAEYEFSGPSGPDGERAGRSARFVGAFRSLRPAPFPVALSSYCRPTLHDIDWASWQGAGFAFLPQAYVNDFGEDVAPAACAAAATGIFAPSNVHPTIGVYEGQRGTIGIGTYVGLLEAAGTVGFSVYLAETGMTEASWSALGEGIRNRGVAAPVG